MTSPQAILTGAAMALIVALTTPSSAKAQDVCAGLLRAYEENDQSILHTHAWESRDNTALQQTVREARLTRLILANQLNLTLMIQQGCAIPERPVSLCRQEPLECLGLSAQGIVQSAIVQGTINIDPGAPAADIYSQSIQLLSQTDYASAQAGFQAVINAYPEDPLAGHAHFWIGEIYMKHRDYHSAVAAFERSYEAFPNGGKAHDSLHKLGLSFAAMGKREEACATFERLTLRLSDAPSHIRESLPAARSKAGCE
jgi:tol-pal system protein YbgF